MGVFEHFPYTNYQDLNLDWLLRTMKDIMSEWDTVRGEFTDLSQAFDDLKDYVENYFLNLDLSTEVSNILQQMLADGDLDQIINDHLDNTVPGVVTQWLNDNVTPVGGAVTVDASLSIGGSAADAAQTGKVYKDLIQNAVGADQLNVIPGFTPPSYTQNGITYTWNAATQTYSVSGTATSNSFINMYYETSKLPGDIKVGDPIFFERVSSSADVKGEFYWYTSGALGYGFPHARFFDIVPANTTGCLIRLMVAAGKTVNATVKLSLTRTASSGELMKSFVYIPGDCPYALSARINKAFQIAPVVILGAGVHQIDSSIEIPENGTLMGFGHATSIECKDITFDAIHIAHNYATVKDLRIVGKLAALPNAPSDGSGIYIDDSVRIASVHNCEIEFFTYAGIRLATNSYWLGNSATITDCVIHHCYAGIYTMPLAEYNRVTGCTIYSCYVGIRNDGGNNVFVNCTLTENVNGFYITDSASTNDGHGALIGCTLNHSNSNTGYGILFNNVSNGFQVSDCHFWYSKVYVDTCEGISFNGCVFARAASPEISNYTSDGTIFANCRFKAAPAVVGVNPLFVNCYTLSGVAVV